MKTSVKIGAIAAMVGALAIPATAAMADTSGPAVTNFTLEANNGTSPRIGSMSVVTGAPGTGSTTLSIAGVYEIDPDPAAAAAGWTCMVPASYTQAANCTAPNVTNGPFTFTVYAPPQDRDYFAVAISTVGSGYSGSIGTSFSR